MANPTASMQIWDASEYDWLTSASGFPPYELQQLWDSWVTEISTNPSMAGRVPETLKDINDSTDPLKIGWTWRFPQNNGDNMYVLIQSINTGVMEMRCGKSYLDDGSNGGYGEPTGTRGGSWTSGSTTQNFFDYDWGFRSSTYTMSFMVVQDVTDGKEFFSISSWQDGANTSTGRWGIMFWRDLDGNWVVHAGQATSSSFPGYGYDNRQGTGIALTDELNVQSNYLPQLLVAFRNVYDSNPDWRMQDDDQYWWMPQNENIISWLTASEHPGKYAYIQNTNEVYLKLSITNLWVRLNPVNM